MLYFTNGIGEMGREYFSVTVQPDGERTLRAQCEMDDDRLLRDVVLTVDSSWRPVDGFVRLSIAEQLVGSSWFCFDDHEAVCEGRLGTQGRLSQRKRTEAPIQSFGTHALHGDTWVAGRVRGWSGAMADFPFVTFATSTLANGGSGPELIEIQSGYARVEDHGDERLKVTAGTFDTRHIRICVPGVDDFDLWAGGEDCLPVRLTSDYLNQTYELVELQGDWR
jgi:hypothetical protein